MAVPDSIALRGLQWGWGELAAATLLVLLFLVDAVVLCRLYVPVAIRAARSLSMGAGKPLVSVILRVGGHIKALEESLPLLLTQEYDPYEVIVVDDSGDDECKYLLERFRQQYPHLRTTTVGVGYKFVSGQMLSLTVGAKAAQGEWLLFTEANGRPASQQWLAGMATSFCPGTDVVLGYEALVPGASFASRLASSLLRWRTLMRIGLALWGRCFIGKMCNLAIRQSAFFAHGGFAESNPLSTNSGDLLLRQLAQRSNTAVVLAPLCHIMLPGPATWHLYMHRRMEQRSTHRKYPWGVRGMLALEPTLQSLMLLGIVLCLVYCLPLGLCAIGLLVVRRLLHGALALMLRARLKDTKWFPGAWLADRLSPILSLCPQRGRHPSNTPARWR